MKTLKDLYEKLGIECDSNIFYIKIEKKPFLGEIKITDSLYSNIEHFRNKRKIRKELEKFMNENSLEKKDIKSMELKMKFFYTIENEVYFEESKYGKIILSFLNKISDELNRLRPTIPFSGLRCVTE